jgi:hypothetical protein
MHLDEEARALTVHDLLRAFQHLRFGSLNVDFDQVGEEGLFAVDAVQRGGFDALGP